VKRPLKEHGGLERPLEALADAVEERKGWRRQNRPWKVSGVEKTGTMVTAKWM